MGETNNNDGLVGCPLYVVYLTISIIPMFFVYELFIWPLLYGFFSAAHLNELGEIGATYLGLAVGHSVALIITLLIWVFVSRALWVVLSTLIREKRQTD